MSYKTIQLSKTADIIIGFPFASEKFNINAQGIRLVRGKNITTGNLRWGDDTRWWDDSSIDLSKYMLKADDIVIGMDGSLVGKNYAKISENDLPLLLVQRVACIRAKEGYDQRFLWGCIASGKFERYIDSIKTGTSIPHISGGQIGNYLIPDFDLPTQKKIAAILSALDEKIAINREINDNLEQQAAALFESWFVDYNPWSGIQPSEWTNAPLGTFVEIKRGGSPRPIQDYLSDSGLRWLKISDVTSLSSPFVLEIKEHIKEEGLKKTVFLHAGELVLSNSATPGIPKILDVDTCIHDGWLYFPKSELSKYYLYLFFKHIRKELVSLGNGSVFTNLKTDILKAFPATKADKVTLKKFDALVSPLFDAMLNADRENLKLATMRDSLLPKLMSGEIDVSAVQL